MTSTSSFKPRPYQKPVIKAIHTGLTKHRRALMRMATGTGKTLTSGFVLQKLFKSGELKKNHRVLFICHNTEILDHAEREYRKIFPKESFGTLTGNEKTSLDAQFIFATFQTMTNYLETFGPRAFTIIVVDEGHHSQAPTYKKVLDHFTPRYRFGMTATPDRMDGQDIRDIFGQELAPLPLVEAIKLGCVTPVSYHMLSLDIVSGSIREIKRDLDNGKRLTKADLDRRLFNESHDEDIAKTINACTGKKIIFCKNIEQAERFVEFIDGAAAYHSRLNRPIRRELFDAFAAGEITTMLVVDAFNEGVDIPDAENVIFLRATESKTIFMQQLGRGLRLAEGKTRVKVLDFVANVERIQLVKKFLDDIGGGGGGGGRSKDPGKEPVFIDFDIDEELVDLIEVLERIDTDFYPTYEEFVEAVRSLRICSHPEYNARYKEDPRLHSNPHHFYADRGWSGWRAVWDNNYQAPYETYKEFVEAVRALGIKSITEYKIRYRENPRLHSNPDIRYADRGWSGWRAVWDNNYQAPYETYKEFVEAVRALGICSHPEYNARYKEDPRLHSNPHHFYADRGWSGWRAVWTPTLQRYETYKEFAEAVRALGIHSRPEYNTRYKEDPRLPSAPNQFYANKGWRGWRAVWAAVAKKTN